MDQCSGHVIPRVVWPHLTARRGHGLAPGLEALARSVLTRRGLGAQPGPLRAGREASVAKSTARRSYPPSPRTPLHSYYYCWSVLRTLTHISIRLGTPFEHAGELDRLRRRQQEITERLMPSEGEGPCAPRMVLKSSRVRR